MADPPDIASLAAVVGEPARARMLEALLGGRALTATELALEAGVAPSTASGHLAKLRAAGLVTLEPSGRHRYFRLAGPRVADVLERLMGLAATGDGPRTGPADPALRAARVCYDHLAGALAVRLLDGLRERGLLAGEDAPAPTQAGRAFFSRLGIDLAALERARRPLCRLCLDWSERRHHLAGALGAAILRHVLAQGWARQDEVGRAVRFTPRGERLFAAAFPVVRGAA